MNEKIKLSSKEIDKIKKLQKNGDVYICVVCHDVTNHADPLGICDCSRALGIEGVPISKTQFLSSKI